MTSLKHISFVSCCCYNINSFPFPSFPCCIIASKSYCTLCIIHPPTPSHTIHLSEEFGTRPGSIQPVANILNPLLQRIAQSFPSGCIEQALLHLLQYLFVWKDQSSLKTASSTVSLLPFHPPYHQTKCLVKAVSILLPLVARIMVMEHLLLASTLKNPMEMPTLEGKPYPILSYPHRRFILKGK